jgi:hypothetical protein
MLSTPFPRLEALNLIGKECPLISQTDQHRSSGIVCGFSSLASAQLGALAALTRCALLRQNIIHDAP